MYDIDNQSIIFHEIYITHLCTLVKCFYRIEKKIFLSEKKIDQ